MRDCHRIGVRRGCCRSLGTGLRPATGRAAGRSRTARERAIVEAEERCRVCSGCKPSTRRSSECSRSHRLNTVPAGLAGSRMEPHPLLRTQNLGDDSARRRPPCLYRTRWSSGVVPLTCSRNGTPSHRSPEIWGSPSRVCAGGWSATTSMPAASRSLAAGCRIRGQHHGVAFDACVPKSEAS